MNCDKCKAETALVDLHKVDLHVVRCGMPCTDSDGCPIVITKEWCPKCLGWTEAKPDLPKDFWGTVKDELNEKMEVKP